VTGAQSHSNGPSLVRIERPRCAKCNERMHLTRIMPGPKGMTFAILNATSATRSLH
jgi:hypothetical protein